MTIWRTMEGVNTSRLPPIVRFQVGGYAAEREPPERSWARIRTCLIDNPRDSALNRRQEIWSYQKKNRGVLKSLVKSLPNIPFRIGKSKRRSLSEQDLPQNAEKDYPFLPQITAINGNESPGRNSKVRPLGALGKNDELLITSKLKSQKNLENSAIRSANVINNCQQQNDEKDKPSKETNRTRLPDIPSKVTQLSKSKRVSFSMNDLNRSSAESDSRSPSPKSDTSKDSEKVVENFGHTSHNITEPIPKSLLDILSGNHLSDARMMSEGTRNNYNVKVNMTTKATSTFPNPESDKIWFEKVLEEKEVIDMSNYENFARTPRTRPVNDLVPKAQQPITSTNDRRSRFANSRSPVRVQFDEKPLRPQRVIGEPIAGHQSSSNSPSYFPVFSRDGSPIRKIGGPPKHKLPPSKLKISFPNSAPVLED